MGNVKIKLPTDPKVKSKLEEELESAKIVWREFDNSVYHAPEEIFSTQDYYKIRMLSELLKTGELDFFKLSKDLCIEFCGTRGNIFCAEAFHAIAKEIDEYCTNPHKFSLKYTK